MKDIPQIPESTAAVHPDLRKSLVRIREELQTLLGLRGDGTGAALRVGDASSGSTTVVIDTGGGGGGGGGAPDLTPPPTPTFGSGDVFPGITTVLLTWAGIGYPQGNGHKQTIVYGVQRDPADPSLPTFLDAERVAVAPDPLTILSIPSEPNTRWHLWLKFETNDGVESAAPAGGTNGVTVTTGQDVADLLAVLTTQITASQLALDLAAPIQSITRNLDDQAASIVLAISELLLEKGQRAAAVLQEKVERETALAAEAALRTALAAEVKDPDTGLPATRALLLTDYYTKASADGLLAAEAGARTLLEAQVNDPVTGLPVTRAALLTESSVRASETGHLAAQATTRLDLNGYVVGYGISGTSGGTAGPTSQFLVRADQFSVVAPTNYTQESAPVGASLNERWLQPSTGIVRRWDGAAWVSFNSLPFTVQAAPTTVNGVTIPAGVYMDAAYIVNLTATYAQISNLIADQISASNINAAQINAGFLSAARIQAGTITADKLNVTLLSAVAASLGSVAIADGGSLRSGQTGYDTGTGFWLGSVAGVPKFSIGDATRALLWDGAELTVRGDVVLKQSIVAAADGYTTLNSIGSPVSSVSASHKFSVIETHGQVVMAGVTGYIDIYLDAPGTNAIDLTLTMRAFKSPDERFGPAQAFSIGAFGLRRYTLVTPNLYVMRVPISLTWSFCGSYYTSRSYPPGASGVPLLPVLNDNILEPGTWDLFLDVEIQSVNTATDTLDAAMEHVRTKLHGWAFEINGAIPYAPSGPVITV